VPSSPLVGVLEVRFLEIPPAPFTVFLCAIIPFKKCVSWKFF
jgi:hypothetical protein